MEKRKRGRQLGNTNTLKHGFYADVFSQTELEEIAYLPDRLKTRHDSEKTRWHDQAALVLY